MLRCSALVAVAVLIPFGAAPVFAQAVADAQPGSAAGRSGPLTVVNLSVSRVLTIVRSHPADAKESGQRRAEIRQAAVELFDFDEMSRRLLGQRWTDATPEEQRDFVVLFTDLLERAYLNTIGNYRLATITFQGETISGSYAQVQSRMAAGKSEVAIEYRLVENDGRWAVYDVAVDGVSLISNYRSQFTSILKRMSFAQMLDRLRNREASMGSRQEAAGQWREHRMTHSSWIVPLAVSHLSTEGPRCTRHEEKRSLRWAKPFLPAKAEPTRNMLQLIAASPTATANLSHHDIGEKTIRAYAG
jgi:phospholipid transport system substrate-binding protein